MIYKLFTVILQIFGNSCVVDVPQLQDITEAQCAQINDVSFHLDLVALSVQLLLNLGKI